MILTGGKQKSSDKNLSQRHFVHKKLHMDWPWNEPGPPRWHWRLTAWAMARPIQRFSIVGCGIGAQEGVYLYGHFSL